ncbi:MAG: acetate--CoA ligase family protein [bacterium]
MLDALFKPRAIAVIGATNNPLSIGYMVMKNLLDHGFKGPVFPVNPKSPYIMSLKAYKSVSDIPDDVDLVNISIKNELVLMVIEECGRKGVKFAIVHTAGFKEIGGEGINLENKIVETARKYGLRIYGPNSEGIENSDESVSVYANFTFTPMTPGNISVLAQSGGVGEVLQLQLYRKGIGIRKYASYGNECDVSMNEILKYYGDDPGTRVILLHIETLKDPIGFLEIARNITRIKPVLAIKSGRTKEGLKAVSSHTGTLMEKDVTTDIIFKKAGILRFDTQDEMIQTAIALSSLPEPKGNRVAMITNTGGPGILAVDEIISSGLELAKLDPKTMDFLRGKLYPEATVTNPVDVLATAMPEQYGAAIEALMNDDNVDSILISFITAKFVDVDGIVAIMAEWGVKALKPLVCVIMTVEDEKRLIGPIRSSGVPVYEFPETGARVLINMTRYGAIRHAPSPEYVTLDVSKAQAERIISECDEGYISQDHAYRILDAYGIPAAKTLKISDEGSIKTAARQLKFPVVLKADAKEIVHKSDSGGLQLGIADEKALTGALEEMAGKFKAHNPSFIVQEQLDEAHEIIVGVNNTEGIGPIIMFGLGGIFVEVMRDVQFRLAPLSRQDAGEMIRSIKGYPILKGTRGKSGADIDSLADILLRVSLIALDFPRIEEMDLNPIFCYEPGKGSKVVDVRLKLGGK